MTRARGFTLLETIIATMLLAGCVLLLFNLYPASALSIRKSHDRFQADAVAQSLLAEQRALPFSELELGARAEPPVTVENTVFERRLEITAPTGNPDVLRAIRVTVSWRWPRGTDRVSHEVYRVNLEK